jgi:hypothetical protein
LCSKPDKDHIECLLKEKEQYTTRQIVDNTGLPLATCWRDLKELEYLGTVCYEHVEEQSGSYGLMKHKPEKDGWTLKEPNDFGILFQECSLLGLVPQNTNGICKSKGKVPEEKGTCPPVVSETVQNELVCVPEVYESLRNQFKEPFLEQKAFDSLVETFKCTLGEAERLFQILVDEGKVLRNAEGYWQF